MGIFDDIFDKHHGGDWYGNWDDHWENEPDPTRRGSYGPPLKCKHCGNRDVYWQRTKYGWQLYNQNTLDRHLCQQSEQPTAEGFDDVD